MNIERLSCYATNSFNNEWANGDIRNKAAIHHINVDPISASSLNCAHFFAQSSHAWLTPRCPSPKHQTASLAVCCVQG